jgi:hypothetical protein
MCFQFKYFKCRLQPQRFIATDKFQTLTHSKYVCLTIAQKFLDTEKASKLWHDGHLANSIETDRSSDTRAQTTPTNKMLTAIKENT